MGRAGVLCGVLLLAGISFVAVGLENTFGEPMLGYTIDYPGDWVVERPADYTVRFAGGAGTPASRVRLTIQNVASTALGGAYGTLEELLDALKCELVKDADDICITLGDPIAVVDAAGRRLTGRQMIVDYSYQGAVYRQWITAVPHASGDVFYVVTYTALRDDYERFEPTILDMLSTWTIGGSTDTGADEGPSSSTTPTATGPITVLLQDAGHIGPYDYDAGAYDKRLYNVIVPSHGYLAISVVDEAGESISGWVLALTGDEVVHKPGNYAEIYTDAYEVLAGTYIIKVGQDTIVTESDFELTVYFSASPFTIDDLEAAFGPRYRTLP